jgi:hypothetical protein
MSETDGPENPVNVFISYSHADESYRTGLQKHLAGLQRQGVIRALHDRVILAGSEPMTEINEYIMQARVILLLISPDFLNSNYCYELEMTQAISRHASGDACVIPIILRPVLLDGEPFAKFQALPRNAKPISTWRNRDEAFADVARGISAVVQQHARRNGQQKLGVEPVESEAETRVGSNTTMLVYTKNTDIELTINRDF